MDVKEQKLVEILGSYSRAYLPINNKNSINKIYDLFVNNIIFKDICDIETFYLGRYYEIITNEYEMMKKYYLKMIDNDNKYSAIIMSNYYCLKERNRKLSKCYLLISYSITTEDSNFIFKYYENRSKCIDIIEMLMNNINSMTNYEKKSFIVKLNNYTSKFCLMCNKDQNKFMHLIKNFEFADDSDLCDNLKLLLKN